MFLVNTKVREASISAVITRANGTVENLGVIAYHSQNPFKVMWFKLKKGVNKLWQQT